MNNDEIIEMARQAGFDPHDMSSDFTCNLEDITAFANLVAAKEREACAKVCDEKVDAEYKTGKVDHNEMGWTQSCAIAIRARGEQA
jgi:hypothetical protein